MPAALTATSTSPAPGTGTGRVAGTSTSGPPWPFASMTVMVSGSIDLSLFLVAALVLGCFGGKGKSDGSRGSRTEEKEGLRARPGLKQTLLGRTRRARRDAEG